MSDWVRKYKPTGSVRTQVMLAAAMWTLVGAGMLTAGTVWSGPVSGAWLLVLTVAAAVVGLIKARLVLRATARRMVERICARGDARCLGGFFSWRTWLLVAGMILLGRLLRSGVVPILVVAFVYQAVGVALLVGASTLWAACSRLPGSA